MSPSERFDAALNGFRQALHMLEMSGRAPDTVYQRPETARLLQVVRMIQRADLDGPDTEPDYTSTH